MVVQPLVVDYNKNIVVTGGGNRADGFLNSVEVFDTHNQVWTTTHSIPPLLSARSWHSLVALKNGRIIVALGGRTNTDDASTSVELFMLDNDGNDVQWIPMPSMEVGRLGFAAFATTTTTPNGILVAGGEDNDRKTLDTMEFVQEPLQDDLVYWSLLNPPPLEKPALTTEGPTADTTIHEDTQSEEWIQDLERQRVGYQNQVLNAILAIRDGLDNPPSSTTTTTRQLAIPPEERIKPLRNSLDKFLALVKKEVKLVRRSAQVGLSGVVLCPPDASSVSSLSSAESEETLGRPDLAPDAQGRKRTATQAELPYGAPDQRCNALFHSFQQGRGSGETPSGFVDGQSTQREMGPTSTNAALQQQEHQDGKKDEEAKEHVEAPLRSEGGNPSGSKEDRQRSNIPSHLSVSSNSLPMEEICVGGTEANSQASSSIGSKSVCRQNEEALREIAMIERYVDNWQPSREPAQEASQGSVGALSVAENSDVTSQGTETREGEIEDFVQLMQQQHLSLLPGGLADMDDDSDKDSLVSSPSKDAQSSQGNGNTTKKDS